MPIDIDKIYRRWVSQYGELGVILKYPSLRGLYSWFLKQSENRGIDPEAIDFESLVDPKLNYDENKGSFQRYFPEISEPELPLKATKAELEKALAMYEEEANELKVELGLPITDVDRINDLEGKVIELETKLGRTREQLKKTREESTRLEEAVKLFVREKRKELQSKVRLLKQQAERGIADA